MRTLISISTTLCLFIGTGAVYGQALPADAQYNLPINLLVNPSFEQGKRGWTNSAGTWTITKTASEINDSLSASKIALSAQSLSFSQSVTTPSGIQKQGVVGLTYKVDSAVTTFQVCSLVDAAEQTCVPSANLVLDGLYHSIEIPVIFGAASAGIKVKSSSSTGNVFIDAAYVKRGIGGTPISIDQARLLGSINYAGTASCSWNSTSTSFANFAANASCPTATLTGSATAPGTKIPAIVFPSMPAGDYVIIATGTFAASNSATTMDFNGRFSDGTNFTAPSVLAKAGTGGTANISSTGTLTGRLKYTTDQTNVTLNLQGLTTSGSNGADITNTTATTKAFEISVYYYPPVATSTLYSQASANTDWVAFTPTSPNSSITLSSSTCYKQRVGGQLNIRCRGTASASTGSEARITIPDSLTSSSAIGTVELVGDMTRSGSSATYFRNTVLIEPSVTYLTFGRQDSTTPSLTKTTGTNTFATDSFSFTASIPIQGWSNAGNIVGSFSGVPKVPGLDGNVDTFSVSFGTTNATTVCSANPCSYFDVIGTGATSMGWTSAGLMTLNLSRTYTKLKCTATVGSSVTSNLTVSNSALSCASCSTLGILLVNGSGTATNGYGLLNCQGSY
jgi:hypothetical protein